MKGSKIIFHTNSTQKKDRVSLLISDKIDFQSNIVLRQIRILSIDKNSHSLRTHNNYKHICSKQQSLNIYEAK